MARPSGREATRARGRPCGAPRVDVGNGGDRDN